MIETPSGLGVAETIATRNIVLNPPKKPDRFQDLTAAKTRSINRDQAALQLIRDRLKQAEPLQPMEKTTAAAVVVRTNEKQAAQVGKIQAEHEQKMAAARSDGERSEIQRQTTEQLSSDPVDKELGIDTPMDVLQEMAEIENVMRDEGIAQYKITHGKDAQPTKEELNAYIQVKMAEIGKAYMQAATSRFGTNFDKVTRLVSRYQNKINNNRDMWEQVKGVVPTPDKTGKVESAQDLIARMKKDVLQQALGDKANNPIAIRNWQYTPYGALFRMCELLALDRVDAQTLSDKFRIQLTDYERSHSPISRFEIDMTGNTSVSLEQGGSIVLSGTGKGGDVKAFQDAFLVILFPDGKVIARNGGGDSELSPGTTSALQTLAVTARNYVEDVVQGVDAEFPDFKTIRNITR